MKLPYSDKVDVACLEHAFDHMSASYKLFWFKAILDSISFGKNEISFEELADSMIFNAWCTQYKSNIPIALADDVLDDLVNYLNRYFDISSNVSVDEVRYKISSLKHKAFLKKKNVLVRNVPYRFLSSFSKESIDWVQPKEYLVNELNSIEGALYKISYHEGLDCKITIEGNWLGYLQSNMAVLLGWVQIETFSYLGKYKDVSLEKKVKNDDLSIDNSVLDLLLI